METIGIDLATSPDVTLLTVRSTQGWRVGDRVYIEGDTHGRYHRVKRVMSATAVEIGVYIRPSKGFRRHIRHAKATKRRQGRIVSPNTILRTFPASLYGRSTSSVTFPPASGSWGTAYLPGIDGRPIAAQVF
jgi:hypothetical protein